MKSKIESITPEMAREYLKRNVHNRNVREVAVEQYAREMKVGNWILTHQGIAFDEKGNLVDGQHRLLAIIQSGCTIQMLVTVGLPASQNNGTEIFTMDVIDKNRPRTTGDQLALMHGVANGKRVAATCSIIAYICAASQNKGLSTPQALSILDIYGKAIDQAIPLLQKFKPGYVAPVIAVVSFAAISHPRETLAFAESLVSGDGIRKGQPVFAMRNWLINGGKASRTWTDHKQTTIEAMANSIHNTIIGESIVLIKSGSNGLNYFRAKQRTNVEKVRLKLGMTSA